MCFKRKYNAKKLSLVSNEVVAEIFNIETKDIKTNFIDKRFFTSFFKYRGYKLEFGKYNQNKLECLDIIIEKINQNEKVYWKPIHFCVLNAYNSKIKTNLYYNVENLAENMIKLKQYIDESKMIFEGVNDFDQQRFWDVHGKISEVSYDEYEDNEEEKVFGKEYTSLFPNSLNYYKKKIE